MNKHSLEKTKQRIILQGYTDQIRVEQLDKLFTVKVRLSLIHSHKTHLWTIIPPILLENGRQVPFLFLPKAGHHNPCPIASLVAHNENRQIGCIEYDLESIYDKL